MHFVSDEQKLVHYGLVVMCKNLLLILAIVKNEIRYRYQNCNVILNERLYFVNERQKNSFERRRTCKRSLKIQICINCNIRIHIPKTLPLMSYTIRIIEVVSICLTVLTSLLLIVLD